MTDIRQWFRGWQWALFIVVLAALMLALVTPRPALPDMIPLPIPDYRRINSGQQYDKQLAQSIYVNPLPQQVRQLGEYYRQFGLAASKRDPIAARLARALIEKHLKLVRAMPEQMLRLRAFHTAQFSEHYQQIEQLHSPSQDFYELSGDFLHTITQAGWFKIEGNKPYNALPAAVAVILFRIRWNEVIGVKGSPFDISLDEQRMLHAFLFRHPIRSKLASSDVQTQKQQAFQYILQKLPSYAAIDPDYPADYAAAIALLHLQRPSQAIVPLSAYLQAHPYGPHALRAINTLRYAQMKLQNRP